MGYKASRASVNLQDFIGLANEIPDWTDESGKSLLCLFGRCLEDCPHADVCFLIQGESVHAHRMILSARSSYFAHKFTRKWRDRSVIELKHRLVRREVEGTS